MRLLIGSRRSGMFNNATAGFNFSCSSCNRSSNRFQHNSIKPKALLSDSAALQGTWTGKELSADSDDACRLVVSGQNFEFHGPDPNEWYKGTFTLREGSDPKVMVAAITECPVENYIGKTDFAIYRLQDGTLTLTAREPGNPDVPAGFDAPETRRFVFKLK